MAAKVSISSFSRHSENNFKYNEQFLDLCIKNSNLLRKVFLHVQKNLLKFKRNFVFLSQANRKLFLTRCRFAFRPILRLKRTPSMDLSGLFSQLKHRAMGRDEHDPEWICMGSFFPAFVCANTYFDLLPPQEHS